MVTLGYKLLVGLGTWGCLNICSCSLYIFNGTLSFGVSQEITDGRWYHFGTMCKMQLNNVIGLLKEFDIFSMLKHPPSHYLGLALRLGNTRELSALTRRKQW